MRQRWNAFHVGLGLFVLVVLLFIVVPCIAKARSSPAYKYHQIHIGMPAEDAAALFGGRQHMCSFGSLGCYSYIYSTDDYCITFDTEGWGDNAWTVDRKSFRVKESAPTYVRWFLKNHSVERSKVTVDGGMQ